MPTAPDTHKPINSAKKARSTFEQLRGALKASGLTLPAAVDELLAKADRDLEAVESDCATLGRQARDFVRDRQATKDSAEVEAARLLQTSGWKVTIRLLYGVGLQFPEAAAEKAIARGLDDFTVQALAYVYDYNRANLKNGAGKEDVGFLFNRITRHSTEVGVLRGWSQRVYPPPIGWEKGPLGHHVVKLACELDDRPLPPDERAETIRRFWRWVREQKKAAASA